METTEQVSTTETNVKIFKHLSVKSHQWIGRNCGKWVLDAMGTYLLDHDKVFPDWATQFAVTLKDIGEEQVIKMGEADVLYEYVMTTPFWEANYKIRKRLLAKAKQKFEKPDTSSQNEVENRI